MTSNSSQGRLWVFAWMFGMVLTGLAVRLVFVQAIQPHVPTRNDGTAQTVVRPARRGEILDVRGNVLAKSRPVYDLHADPVVIGTNAAVLAAYAAPILGRSQSDLVQLMTPRPELRTNRMVQVDGGLVTTQWVTRWFTNRSVLVQSNVSPETLALYREGLSQVLLPRYVALSEALKSRQKAAPRPWERLESMIRGEAPALKQEKQALARMRRELVALRLQQAEIRINGLTAYPVEQRVYPQGIAAAHVLGYTTNDVTRPERGVPVRLIGATGIENRFDAELRGVTGLLETQRVKGRELVAFRGRDLAARDGLNVRLTIDSHLQSIVEQALDEAVERINPKGIVCIMVRPATGEILAMANRPTYDPNDLRMAPVDHRMNRAITLPSEPGSTFKILTYAAGIDLGLATIDDLVDCAHGTWQPPSGRPIRDTAGHGLGVVPFEEAFAKSSNVGAARLGLRMSPQQMIAYMKRFGFLQRTGVMYASRNNWGGEHPGGIPEPGRMNIERQGRMSYGYGLYVTPLQTVMAAAAIANDGVLMKPLLVRSLETAEGRVVMRFDPARASDEPAIRPETAAQMKRALRSVVTDGTAKIVAMEDYDVAGKTGTAHKVDPATRRQSNEKYTSTFVGYLPADKPEICLLVLADEPDKRGGGSHFGGRACGPVFTAVAQQAASYLAIPPSMRTNVSSQVSNLPIRR
jgi:cell division protein FtsI/penicillin-binding protein 2